MVKSEGEGSLFEKVESEENKETKQQVALSKSAENVGVSGEKAMNKHPSDTDDKVVVSELDENTGEQ